MTTIETERGTYLAGLLSDLRARVASGDRLANAFGQSVRILTIASSGVRVRFPDGHIERVHPEDVR